jgi:hypothetical protein
MMRLVGCVSRTINDGAQSTPHISKTREKVFHNHSRRTLCFPVALAERSAHQRFEHNRAVFLLRTVFLSEEDANLRKRSPNWSAKTQNQKDSPNTETGQTNRKVGTQSHRSTGTSLR